MQRTRLAWVALILITSLSRAYGAEAPIPVTIGVYVVQITGVDLKNSAFTMDFYLWFRWKGDTIKPQDTWEIANGRVLSKSAVSFKKLGDENYAFLRVNAQISHLWDLHDYPLDRQLMKLSIEDSENESQKLIYVADGRNSALNPGIRVAGWQIGDSTASVQTTTYDTNYGDTSLPTGNMSTYSRFVFSVAMSRPGVGRFLKVFFPLIVATLISWLAFWMAPTYAAPRVSIGVGALFAAAAASLAINNALPDTNIVTMADRLIILSLATIFATCLLTVRALLLSGAGRTQAQQRSDHISGYVFPLLYALILYLWVL